VARGQGAFGPDRLGRLEEAAKHYEIFAEVWKNCDPEFRPMLDHARTRIAVIRNAQTAEKTTMVR